MVRFQKVGFDGLRLQRSITINGKAAMGTERLLEKYFPRLVKSIQMQGARYPEE
jgi:hypothetical protein